MLITTNCSRFNKQCDNKLFYIRRICNMMEEIAYYYDGLLQTLESKFRYCAVSSMNEELVSKCDPIHRKCEFGER